LAVEPRRIYFGRLRKSMPHPEKYVVLSGTEKGITKITSVISKNNHIKTEVVPPETENKNKPQQIKVTVLPDMKVGRFNEVVTIHTDHKEKKKLTFYVSGEIVGNIAVLPSRISFGMFKKGGKYEKRIRLKAAPGVVFKVLDVKSTTPGLTPKIVTVKEGTEYLVRVSMEESFDKDIMNEKITITTDDKEQEKIVVNVSGRGYKQNLRRRKPKEGAGPK